MHRFADSYGPRVKTARSLVTEAWEKVVDASSRKSPALARDAFALLAEAAKIAKSPADVRLVESSRASAIKVVGALWPQATGQVPPSRPAGAASIGRTRPAYVATSGRSSGICSVCGDATDHDGDGHPSYDVEDEDAARALARRQEAIAARRTRGIF